MINDLKTTIELLKQINSNLAEQLQYTNRKLEELENVLNQAAITQVEPVSLPEDTENITSSDEVHEEAAKELQENKAKETDEQIESLQQRIRELEESVDKLTEENKKYKSIIRQRNLNELSSIGDVISSLNQKVQDLYSCDKVIYSDVSEIARGYQEMREFYLNVPEEKTLEFNDLVNEELIAQINSYSWVNTVLRLGAYAKLDLFNIHRIVADELLLLEKRVTSLYAQYGIEFIVPELLTDVFDTEKYEFDNDNTIWIEKYCDLSPIEHVGKVYDIVQVGYKTSSAEDGLNVHKPIVYYN